MCVCTFLAVHVHPHVPDSSNEDEVVDNMKYTICGILSSPLFDKKAVLQRSLKVYFKFVNYSPVRF